MLGKRNVFFICTLMLSLLSCSFGSMLEFVHAKKASNIYVFNQELISNGSSNKLLCAYDNGDGFFSPFTDVTQQELSNFKRNNINLIRFAPKFHLSSQYNSIENLKTQHQLSDIRASGISVWVDILRDNLYPVVSNDVNVIADPSTEKDWCDAVSANQDTMGQTVVDLARAWDIRIELLLQKRISNWGNFFCESFGARVADNPIFGIWSFESNWLDRMCAGEWIDLPEFFVKSLSNEWNNWVYNEVVNNTPEFKDKYGFLVDGESIEEGTLKLVASKPLSNDNESNLWIAIEEETNELYNKSARSQLQNDFFAQLYLKHIDRLKDTFVGLGSVSRDAPYFITMSTNNNVNVSSTDVFFGVNKKPYVLPYSSKSFEDKTFSSAKELLEQNNEIGQASVIMLSNEDIKLPSPFTFGITTYLGCNCPSRSYEAYGCFDASKKISVVEKKFDLSFGLEQAKTLEGIYFNLVNTSPKIPVTNIVNNVSVVTEQQLENNDFSLSITLVKTNTQHKDKYPESVRLYLNYDESKSKNVSLQIKSDLLVNYSLVAMSKDENKAPKVYQFKKHWPITIPLNTGSSILIIEKQNDGYSIPLEF